MKRVITETELSPYNKPPAQYCEECGILLYPTFFEIDNGRHDQNTGKLISYSEAHYECPQHKWFGSKHTKGIMYINRFGDWVHPSLGSFV